MGIPVLILGESGSGKSTSLRNFDPNEIGVFNVGGKPLPFRKKMKVINGATYNTIMKEFQKPNFKGLIKFVIDQMPNDVIVYFLQHVEMSPTGIIKAKTMGKLLDEKDTIEGRCAIVLLCKSEKSKHFFVTQSEGVSTAKSPMDMFDSLEIDNDLKMVDQTIREYWNLNEKENA